MKLAFLFLFAFVVLGCFQKQDIRHGQELQSQKKVTTGNTEVRYAKGFTLKPVNGGILVTVKNPWIPGDTLATYFLKDEKSVESQISSDFILTVPVGNVAVLSSTFLGMFLLLGDENRIGSATDARLIYDSVLYQRYLKGDLTDLGEFIHLNVEAVIAQSPGLVMKYIYGTTDETDRMIREVGIPIAYNLEYMEPHPLGRTEWIKFVAAFTGKLPEADSLFRVIEGNYLQMAGKAETEINKPTVLDGSGYKGIWYTAGGKSYPARLYHDAGADYFWKNDTGSGSIPVSFEVIIEKQAGADFWIGPSTGNREELLKIESRYALLKPFREGNVFYFGKRINSNGGYDYYESGVVRPDILLSDLVSIFHPALLDAGYETVYLEKIK